MELRQLCFSLGNGRESWRKPSGRATIRALLSLFLSLSSRFCLLTSPYQGSVKTVPCALLWGEEWHWGRERDDGGGGHTMLLDMHLHMHTADGTGGALNKHTHTHLLADGRLGVRQCPLMNVYGESKGPSSFRPLSMRCSVMTMVIPPSLHNNHTQVMVSKWFISITHIRQMLLRTRVNLSWRRHRLMQKERKCSEKKYIVKAAPACGELGCPLKHDAGNAGWDVARSVYVCLRGAPSH